MLSFHVKFVQTDRRTDRQMDRQTEKGKTIWPPPFDAGHKNIVEMPKLQEKSLHLQRALTSKIVGI